MASDGNTSTVELDLSGDARADLTSHDTYTAGVPHATFARLRREEPVCWVEERDGSGFWAVTRYRDIIDVSRDVGTYTSTHGIRLEEMTEEETLARQTMMEQDPPDHTRLRRLVSRGFTRRKVEEYEDQIRELAAEVVTEAVAEGQFDFVEAVATQLPMKMLGRLLGTPDEDGMFLVEQGDALLGNSDPDFTDHVIDQTDTDEFRLIPFRSPAGLRLFDYARQQAALRREDPTTDIISQLLAETTDGSVLSEHEFNNFFTLLVAAGNDTTRYTMTGGLKALLERPHLLNALRDADDDAWRTAVDEILRWTSVTTHFRRTATVDTELRGVPISAGDKVLVYFISGDFDDEQFENPYTFDVTRDPNDHMAFGRGGPHLCLGAWLARMEIRVTLQEFLKRIDGIEQIGEERYLRSNFIAGIKSLPVRVTPIGA
ncbi:MAG: cytochrome P450 [Actinomycetota bacterium]